MPLMRPRAAVDPTLTPRAAPARRPARAAPAPLTRIHPARAAGATFSLLTGVSKVESVKSGMKTQLLKATHAQNSRPLSETRYTTHSNNRRSRCALTGARAAPRELEGILGCPMSHVPHTSTVQSQSRSPSSPHRGHVDSSQRVRASCEIPAGTAHHGAAWVRVLGAEGPCRRASSRRAAAAPPPSPSPVAACGSRNTMGR